MGSLKVQASGIELDDEQIYPENRDEHRFIVSTGVGLEVGPKKRVFSGSNRVG